MKKILINKTTKNVLGWYNTETLTDDFIIKEIAENKSLPESDIELIEYTGTEMPSSVKHKYNPTTQLFETRSDWVPPVILSEEELAEIKRLQEAQIPPTQPNQGA
jgi:hypothetical protein